MIAAGPRPVATMPRTGFPPTRPYRRGEPRQPWALKALADAEAAYGAPAAADDLYDLPDIGPSYEWYRELAIEAADPPAAPAPAYCDGCGYLTSAIGHKITCGAS